jgi:hypothetical protein
MTGRGFAPCCLLLGTVAPSEAPRAIVVQIEQLRTLRARKQRRASGAAWGAVRGEVATTRWPSRNRERNQQNTICLNERRRDKAEEGDRGEEEMREGWRGMYLRVFYQGAFDLDDAACEAHLCVSHFGIMLPKHSSAFFNRIPEQFRRFLPLLLVHQQLGHVPVQLQKLPRHVGGVVGRFPSLIRLNRSLEIVHRPEGEEGGVSRQCGLAPRRMRGAE